MTFDLLPSSPSYNSQVLKILLHNGTSEKPNQKKSNPMDLTKAARTNSFLIPKWYHSLCSIFR